jgi:hypothetical protein
LQILYLTADSVPRIMHGIVLSNRSSEEMWNSRLVFLGSVITTATRTAASYAVTFKYHFEPQSVSQQNFGVVIRVLDQSVSLVSQSLDQSVSLVSQSLDQSVSLVSQSNQLVQADRQAALV